MIYDMAVAWRNLHARPIQTAIPALVIALALALSLAVAMLSDGAKEGIIQASDPFGVMVIGAKGSSQQLVLSSILLQDDPIGNIPYTIYDDLEHDERVQLAVPLAFGDNVAGARLIGTNHDFFELRTSRSAPPAFQLADGRLFAVVEDHEHEEDAEHDAEEHEEGDEHHDEGLFEAVLGATAAKDLGLKVGDQFETTHGFGEGIATDHHHEPYTVVGILKPSGTAYDGAAFTQIESVWHVHEVDPNDSLAPYMGERLGASDQVTAVLVLPASFAGQNQIYQEFYTGTEAQAAFPGTELTDLFELIDQAQEILGLIGYMVLGIAALTVFLSMYNATVAREHAIAVMRGLGSSPAHVVRIVLFETLFVTLLGAILGRVIGYGAAQVVADAYSARSAIPVPLRLLPEWEALLWALPLGVGALAGLVPAALAYRVNVVEKLFPS
ncbi:MAG TPA: ABC transporter permease [Aggregatilinea sp.]|uniref:ABC transporter permease n=1 Tax=Aggregatilinea sp. TaxID=2806333 RepID=UPI002C46FA32|nr:ABC transporter permease [Aggregatilinea sp.]HML23390.1 ABC transporter permease [Aggregatilinea sp.]